MKLSKMIIVLIISFVLIICFTFGVSYAWYSYSHAESNINASAINDKPTITFDQTEYISDMTIIPISDEDRYQYANFNGFQINFDEKLENYEVGIEINLENIDISSELVNVLYKYELVENGKIVSSGNFTTLKGDKLTLLPMHVVNLEGYPIKYEYKLYIWLSDDGSVQNELMNKSFSGKIVLNTAIKAKGR